MWVIYLASQTICKSCALDNYMYAEGIYGLEFLRREEVFIFTLTPLKIFFEKIIFCIAEENKDFIHLKGESQWTIGIMLFMRELHGEP